VIPSNGVNIIAHDNHCQKAICSICIFDAGGPLKQAGVDLHLQWLGGGDDFPVARVVDA
jgi:hypothetical protein